MCGGRLDWRRRLRLWPEGLDEVSLAGRDGITGDTPLSCDPNRSESRGRDRSGPCASDRPACSRYAEHGKRRLYRGNAGNEIVKNTYVPMLERIGLTFPDDNEIFRSSFQQGWWTSSGPPNRRHNQHVGEGGFGGGAGFRAPSGWGLGAMTCGRLRNAKRTTR